MIDCPVCKGKLTLSKLKCGDCGIVMEGNFTLPRLARLPLEMRVLAEQMVLCGGNLKELATEIGISYPTLRRKIDELIATIAKLKADDDNLIASILDGIDKGTIKSEEGIRRIREIQSEI
ncbi:MAG: DUF2089 domain-containing protein [Micavibrio aeruginosavorus]|uniref:DUF2089 domain-containing protein n=1 Tax=Micavibrio aeruginosavorus TaxID=349221 RepID=A0A7T5R0K6_9BACT|nr:MAG: DUF2089 domain-containing protein [Micavibrio aeruginosavorus]